MGPGCFLAKKRRQKIEKKEEYDFNFPEFDEHQFVSLEINKAKISFVAFIFAIIMVIITYQLYVVTHPDARGPMVFGIFAAFAIPFIAKWIKLDTSEFDWKNWVGAGAVYVMTWLAIFILVLNPPFSDFIHPVIYEDEIELTYQQSNNNTWKSWDTEPDPPILTAPVKINISVKILDNVAVDKDSVKLIIIDSMDNTTKFKMNHIKDNQYRVVITNNDQVFPKGKYSFSIEAKDVNGHKSDITNMKFEIP